MICSISIINLRSQEINGVIWLFKSPRYINLIEFNALESKAKVVAQTTSHSPIRIVKIWLHFQHPFSIN
jgi:hypothetical protein